MKKTLTRLVVVEQLGCDLSVPASLYKDSLKQAAFGTMTAPCLIQSSEREEIQISTELMTKLQIPFAHMMHPIIVNETIHLGPLIGVLSAGFTGSLLRPIGKRSLHLAKLLSTASITGGLPFIFGTHHINWETGTINGYFYEKSGWTQHEVPLPNVVYNRLPNRKTEGLAPFKFIKEKMMTDYGIPFFNPDFFNKWEIHELLKLNEQTAYLLPYTVESPSCEQIKKLLLLHQTVYLKPKNGSLGRGIYTLSFKDSMYTLTYKGEKGLHVQEKETLENLLSEFEYLLTNPSYIAQQGISLIKKEKRCVDFRVHTNKDGNNKWVLTALAAKVAGPNSITTHLDYGGEIEATAKIFTNPSYKKEIENKLKDAAISISHVLEQELNGLIGELGFDFGVDYQGNVWLFEANSKPGRSIFSHPALRKADQQTRKLSLEYTIYLSGYYLNTPEGISI